MPVIDGFFNYSIVEREKYWTKKEDVEFYIVRKIIQIKDSLT